MPLLRKDIAILGQQVVQLVANGLCLQELRSQRVHTVEVVSESIQLTHYFEELRLRFCVLIVDPCLFIYFGLVLVS